ncbi:cysteine hydrolase family protein [Caloramator sp. Dgby_cultured_2]|uniref:cysteine hydrolase family protein n=1 Tax=Caloramator sp. Dgby_cultured_2 TaxID=3029174 RepID=UPI00237DE9AF|nr:isochorismatase family cysteine hydrolase [Caloramator sp. Dgby_cultured_2]WDU83264.1 cysteine hydrolase [Caloramator sp. Dgby_cultured_2]
MGLDEKKALDALEEMKKFLDERPHLDIKELNSKETVLVIVDMINGFCKEGNLSSPRIKALIPETERILRLCKENEIKAIAFVDSHSEDSPEFSSYPSHCVRGTWESEVVDELKEVAELKIINKNSTNGFLEDEFQDWLKNNPQIKNFIIVGDCTDICVEQFANTLKAYFNMKNIKARVIVPISAVETYDLGYHYAELLNIVALMIMAGNGVEIVKTVK